MMSRMHRYVDIDNDKPITISEYIEHINMKAGSDVGMISRPVSCFSLIKVNSVCQ